MLAERSYRARLVVRVVQTVVAILTDPEGPGAGWLLIGIG